ncbi:MAG: orotidine-5'-phosphate decarboxylase [Armatimonadetes bacterium]|nr:orotidine-5'-phosphate decarboxylase [Armatimonadota bacterium]
MRRKIICAIDTGDLDVAIAIVRRLNRHVGAFKIGHALTLPHGLDVVDRLTDAGADRIFLDLKFHDIPNSVALGVREAAKRRVWMTTLHLAGGPAMLTAAVEEAHEFAVEKAPLLIGVSVLTSLDEATLKCQLGVNRSLIEHMVAMSEMGMECGMDGVVCSAHEIPQIRAAIGHGVIVTPGIRPKSHDPQDQKRVADAQAALSAGSDYLVIGRALTDSQDPVAVMHELGLIADEVS